VLVDEGFDDGEDLRLLVALGLLPHAAEDQRLASCLRIIPSKVRTEEGSGLKY
jgi:hypothetical protein